MHAVIILMDSSPRADSEQCRVGAALLAMCAGAVHRRAADCCCVVCLGSSLERSFE